MFRSELKQLSKIYVGSSLNNLMIDHFPIPSNNLPEILCLFFRAYLIIFTLKNIHYIDTYSMFSPFQIYQQKYSVPQFISTDQSMN